MNRLLRTLYLATLLIVGATAQAQVDYTIGTGTTPSGNFVYPTPMQDYWEGSRSQYLILASELQAAGVSPGSFSALKFNVTSLNSTTLVEGLTIKMGTTSLGTIASGTWLPNINTTVYGPFDYQPVAGINTFNFSAPFLWNGSDNLVVEMCNGSLASTSGTTWSNNPIVNLTTGLSFNASRTYRADDDPNLCSYVGTLENGTATSRPNMTFSFTPSTACTGTPQAGQATSTADTVCNGVNFTLGLTGQTLASGLSYRWQRSTDNVNWSFIDTARSSSSYALSQNASFWYRAQVTCGANSSFSTSRRIFTPTLIAAGTYTINASAPPSATNFTSLAAAVDFIKCGVAGNVTFNVAPNSGPYTEQVIIPEIGGNRQAIITFNGNGNTLSPTTSAANPMAITLNGADRIVLDSFTIDLSAAAANATAIWLTNRADSNIIRRNMILLNLTTTAATVNGIVGSNSMTSVFTGGNVANFNTIERNTITGGYYGGIWLYGAAAAPFNLGNRILQNTIVDQHSYGIYLYGNAGATISQNNIYRSVRTNSNAFTQYGLFYSVGDSSVIDRNLVHDMYVGQTNNTSTFYGYYINSSTTNATRPLRVVNNAVFNIGNNGPVYGIYHNAGNNVLYAHNTLVLDNTAANTTSLTYGFQSAPTGTLTGTVFRNNIVYINRGGTGIKANIWIGNSSFVTNNNVLYQGSTSGSSNFIGSLNGVGSLTLTDWKARTFAPDANSIDNDPLLSNLAANDLTPSEPLVNGIGAPLGITSDINGKTRSNSPDPGAVEIDLPPCGGTPQPGQVLAPSNVCANTIFTLSLQNSSLGGGIRYQWQTATASTGPWTNLDTAQLGVNLQTQQTASRWYRANVSCGANSANSQPVQVTSPALVSGTLTVNPAQPVTATNFSSLSEALRAIQCGISGAVTINIAPNSGPYVDSMIINPINGAAANRRITINGNGNTIVSNFNSTTGTRAIIQLNGADFITIDSLVFDQSAATSNLAGWGVFLTNNADSNIIRRCVWNGPSSGTSTNFAGVVMSASPTSVFGSGDNGRGNLFERNTFNGGGYGIVTYGNSTLANYNVGNHISMNNFRDQFSYGIYSVYQTSQNISKNDLSRPLRNASSTFLGAITASSVNNLRIEKNRIHNLFDGMTAFTSTFYGISLTGGGIDSATRNVVVNNAIYAFGNSSTTGSFYGIYSPSYAFNSYFHNTVVMDEPGTSTGITAAFYAYGTNNILRNNIAVVNRPGNGTRYGYYFGSSVPQISNNNLVYMPANSSGTNVPFYLVSNFTSLAAWQASNANQFDQASQDIDPVFDANAMAGGNYVPTNTLVNNRGVNVGVTQDIRDSIRSVSLPDIGAWEFSTNTAGTNLSAVGVLAPANQARGCYDSTQVAQVRILNVSENTHNFATQPATVSLLVGGARNLTITTVVNTGTLAKDSFLTVTLPSNTFMTLNGQYNLRGMVKVNGNADAFPNNDTSATVVRTRVALAAGAPNISIRSVCFTGNSRLLASNATGFSSLQWQQSTNGGSSWANVGTNNDTLNVNAVTQTTYYRVNATCLGSTSNGTADSIVVSAPALGSSAGDSVCISGSMVLKSTLGAGALNNAWYAANSGGTALATTLNYTTPVLTSTTNYFVAASAGGSTQGFASTGQAWNSVSTTGSFQTTSIGGANQVFTTSVPLTISSVIFYPAAAVGSNFVIEVRQTSGTGTLVGSFTGTTTVTNSGTPSNAQTANININIPTPGTYAIGFATNPNTWRTDHGAVQPYPVSIPGVLQVTGSNLGQLYWYYIYGWTVSTGCESPRTQVVARVKPANDPSCATVPVTLSRFAGQKVADGHLLSWTTLTEQGNAGFTLQRSVDGRNFEPIAQVNSLAPNGNSHQPLDYSFLDRNPARGDNYYRLVQTDLGTGRQTLSSVVKLANGNGGELVVKAIYPNPVTTFTNLVVSSSRNQDLQIVITDMAGKVLSSQRRSVVAGNQQLTISTGALASGTYLLKVLCADGCQLPAQRMVKQ